MTFWTCSCDECSGIAEPPTSPQPCGFPSPDVAGEQCGEYEDHKGEHGNWARIVGAPVAALRALPDFVTLDPNKGSCGETPGAHWHCTPHLHSGTWVGQADNTASAHAEALAHLDKLHPGWDQPTTPS